MGLLAAAGAKATVQGELMQAEVIRSESMEESQ